MCSSQSGKSIISHLWCVHEAYFYYLLTVRENNRTDKAIGMHCTNDCLLWALCLSSLLLNRPFCHEQCLSNIFRKNSRIRDLLMFFLSYSLVRRWISIWTNRRRNQLDRLVVIIRRSNRMFLPDIRAELVERWMLSPTKSHQLIDLSAVVKSNSFVRNSCKNGQLMFVRPVSSRTNNNNTITKSTSFVPIRRIEWRRWNEKNMIDIKTKRCFPAIRPPRRRRCRRWMKLISLDCRKNLLVQLRARLRSIGSVRYENIAMLHRTIAPMFIFNHQNRTRISNVKSVRHISRLRAPSVSDVHHCNWEREGKMRFIVHVDKRKKE